MKMLTESKLKKIIKEEFNNRILAIEAAFRLLETKVFDDEGNLLLSPGLKVKHEDSGYEYSIDHVDGEGPAAIIYLRHPDVPRFDPPENLSPLNELEEEVITPKPVASKQPPSAQSQVDKSSLLSVTVADFEKDYIVD